jgi:BREX system ATP-binding protein BrxC/D
VTSTLGNLLKNVMGAEERRNEFLAGYGMLRNPFPPARTIYPEVIYNQEQAVTKFATGVGAIIGDEIARRSLAVLGGTGQGKSHFQRHCQYEVQSSNLPIVTVEFLAGTGSSQVLVREIYRAADEYVKRDGFLDLLSAVLSRAEDGKLGPVRQSDLRAALLKLIEASRDGYVPQDMNRRFDFPTLLDVCRRWVVGETLTQTEKRYLRVSGRLSSGSLIIRVMTELFALAREQGLFRGVMLCLDEVEAVFSSGVSTSRIQAFLQDLRYLFDEARGQTSGYSLLVVSGSTGAGANSLSNYNYPLFQRLGFEGEARVALHQVSDLEEARRFADVYLEHEHGRFTKVNGPGPGLARARSLIDDDDLRHAFFGPDLVQTADQRNQARLLEELHRIVEAKRASADRERG